MVAKLIELSEDPISLVNGCRRPWNSEGGNRIRLDSSPCRFEFPKVKDIPVGEVILPKTV